MPADPVAIALLVTEALEELAVPHVIGGSFASSTHGFARATQDIDIVAELEPRHVNALVAALSSRFYVDGGAVRRATRERTSFNLVHLEEMYKIDVFVPPATPFARRQIERRRLETVVPPDRRAWVLSPEDTVLQKLRWYRDAGQVSERQWRDVVGVLKVQGDRLDLDALRREAAEVGVLDLMERAIAESRAPLA